MNTLRLSTLSLTLVVAVFALGYANPSFAAPKKCADAPEAPGCNGNTSDDGDVALYRVEITGDVVGGSHQPNNPSEETFWRGDFGGKKDIGLNDAVIGTMVGEFTGLSVFTADPSLFDGNSIKCFPLDKNKLVPLTIHQASVSQGKQGRAEAGFFFDGFTFNGGAVLATLKLIGTFTLVPWPPQIGGDVSMLDMTDWELSVTNEGKAIKSISCIGKGQFTTGVTIEVTKIDP